MPVITAGIVINLAPVMHEGFVFAVNPASVVMQCFTVTVNSAAIITPYARSVMHYAAFAAALTLACLRLLRRLFQTAFKLGSNIFRLSLRLLLCLRRLRRFLRLLLRQLPLSAAATVSTVQKYVGVR